jgi:diacylglycerol kinase (ATP)
MADGKPGLVPRGPMRMWHATQWSFRGLTQAFRHESSFRLEVYLFVVLAPIGMVLGASAIERVLLVGSLMLVLVVELMNSGLEAIVDKASPEFNELAGRAKDMGSAAVFVSMLHVLLCWGLILGARL